MSANKLKLGVHSEAGKLHRVMVCSPGLAHLRLTPGNCDELLFDDVIWVAQAKRDRHDQRPGDQYAAGHVEGDLALLGAEDRHKMDRRKVESCGLHGREPSR